MQLSASRRRDWLQQYANANYLQKLAKVFANFCKFLEAFATLYFILHASSLTH